jgi:hypothetical protein
MRPTTRERHARRLNRAVALALLCLVPVGAGRAFADGVGTGAAAPYIDCKCRANGRTYGLGERACLYTPGGFRTARCRMVLNVTSWAVEGEEGCVSSGLQPGGARG